MSHQWADPQSYMPPPRRMVVATACAVIIAVAALIVAASAVCSVRSLDRLHGTTERDYCYERVVGYYEIKASGEDDRTAAADDFLNAVHASCDGRKTVGF